jgi:7-carboxy-7-deazaguanine synthase
MYSVKEIFYTLQGEGTHAGRPAVFCRFAGCNLWSGREDDRFTATCRFCDTDFVGTDGTIGGKYQTADQVADVIAQQWPATNIANRFVVLTGGEPLLQVDVSLIDELKRRNFVIALETNGTLLPPPGIDWICVSPKVGAHLRLCAGNELKFVYPQGSFDPAQLEALNFERFYLQPMDGPNKHANTEAAVKYCLGHPTWRLSTQTHKIIGVR